MLKSSLNLDLFSGLSILFDSAIYFPVTSDLDNAFHDLARQHPSLLFQSSELLLCKLFRVHSFVRTCMCVHEGMSQWVCGSQTDSLSFPDVIILYVHPTLIKTKNLGVDTSICRPSLALSDHAFLVFFWPMVEPTQTRCTQGSCVLRLLQLGQPLSP